MTNRMRIEIDRLVIDSPVADRRELVHAIRQELERLYAGGDCCPVPLTMGIEQFLQRTTCVTAIDTTPGSAIADIVLGCCQNSFVILAQLARRALQSPDDF